MIVAGVYGNALDAHGAKNLLGSDSDDSDSDPQDEKSKLLKQKKEVRSSHLSSFIKFVVVGIIWRCCFTNHAQIVSNQKEKKSTVVLGQDLSQTGDHG